MEPTPNVHEAAAWQVRASRVRWLKALAAVGTAVVVGVVLELRVARAMELTFVIKALMYAGMALIFEHPFLAAVPNVFAATLLGFVVDDVKAVRPWRRVMCQLSLSLNRSAGHVEAQLAWVTLAVVWSPRLWIQAGAVTAVLAIGPILVDRLSVMAARKRDGVRATAALYGVTLLGALLVVFSDPAQSTHAWPLLVPVLGGMIPRFAYWSYHAKKSPGRRSRAGQAWADRLEKLMIAAALAGAVVVPLSALGPGAEASELDELHRTLSWRRCEPAAESAPELTLFIVSDSQFHALDGERSGLNMDAVDGIVPVASRPVELDLLSEATLRHFGKVFTHLREARPAAKWVHLGDAADLGCASEVERFLATIPAYGAAAMATLVLGNHDVAFTGNLGWHPEWSRACVGGRSDRSFAQRQFAAAIPAGDREVSREETFLASVVPLGQVGGREVVGAFLDTSDQVSDGIGIAGAQGGISRRQREWVEGRLARHPDARVIFFGHHPVDELTADSRAQLDRLARTAGDQLWAIVSAHTHLAARRTVTLGGRELPELVVGSTIDPPQEAALLEAGTDGAGDVYLRMRTVPAVQRAELACPSGSPGAIPDADCSARLAELRQSPSCGPLFAAANEEKPPLSARCEAAIGAAWQMLELGTRHAQTPEQLACVQELRAARLLRCIAPALNPAEHVLTAQLPGQLTALFESGAQDTLVCLSWAASIAQAHKAEHWGMARSLEFALEQGATYGSLETTIRAAPARPAIAEDQP